MNQRELLEEYLTAMRRMKLEHARQLVAHGIPIQSITVTCPAPMRLRRFGDRYLPDEAATSAWILPVCAGDPESLLDIEAVDPIATVSIGVVIDLLAFSP